MHVAGDAWSLLHFFGLDLDLMLLLAVAAFQVFPPHKRKINWPKPKFKVCNLQVQEFRCTAGQWSPGWPEQEMRIQAINGC